MNGTPTQGTKPQQQKRPRVSRTESAAPAPDPQIGDVLRELIRVAKKEESPVELKPGHVFVNPENITAIYRENGATCILPRMGEKFYFTPEVTIHTKIPATLISAHRDGQGPVPSNATRT